MTQTARLLDALKFYLKVQGITYRSLAQRLKLSESSIKRLFSEESLSLKRLERILKVLDLDFYELAKMTHRHERTLSSELTEEQHQALVKQPRLLLVAYLVVTGWSHEEITQQYNLTLAEVNALLLELDRLEVVELYPGDRLRLRVSRQALIAPGSPLWQLCTDEVLPRPSRPTLCLPLALSEDSQRLLKKDLDKLHRRAYELAEADQALAASERQHTLLYGHFEAWEPPFLRRFRKEGSA